MKKIKNLSLALLLVFGSFALVGCKQAEEVVDKEAEAIKKIEEIEKDVEKEIADMEEVSEEKVHEAIDYINDNIIEPVEDGEVMEKLIYYGYYLQEVAKEETGEIEHDVAVLGNTVYNTTKDNFTKVVVEGEKLTDEFSEAVDNILSSVIDAKDLLVKEVSEKFSK